MDKAELRQLILSRKRQYSQQELEALSLVVISRLMSHPIVSSAQTILLYYSLPDEVNTHQCVDMLRSMGKTVLLPKVIGECTMEIRKYNGPTSLQEGAFHIMEPCGDIFTDYNIIELAIVPGMSFDSDGNRLGRGKGYYDRILAQLPHVYKIGICFDFQKTKEVPKGHWDIPMDEVL